MNPNQAGLTFNQPMQALERARVLNPNMQDIIYEPLYDTLTYPAAGASELAFFQEGIGRNGKTIVQTNMETNGTIPTGQNFIITGVELWFVPAALSNTAAVTKLADDVRTFTQNGALVLNVSSKDYIRQAPLGSFPPSSHVEVDAATTVAANNIQQAYNVGQPFNILNLTLSSNVNFKATLYSLPALPSTQAGKIIMKLNGFKYRNVQ